MPPKKIKTLNDWIAEENTDYDSEFAFSDEAVENFYVFLKEARLLDQGIRLLDPDKFFWLDPVYRITRTDLFGIKDADGSWLQKPRFPNGIVFRKAAQMGASTWAVAFMIWLCIDEEKPVSIGSYWPTKEELENFISTRLDPMLEHSEQLAHLMKDADFDNTKAKKIARSTIYFRHVAGKSAMDAVPMDLVFCDEVRLWDGLYPGGAAAAIERIRLRMGQSDIALMFLMSTVGIPEDYMEERWFESNMMQFFARCPEGCGTEVTPDPRQSNRLIRREEYADAQHRVIEGVVLSDHAPTDIVKRDQDDEADAGGRFICPCCQTVIEDKTQGRYVALYPHRPRGMFAIEFARTLSTAPDSNPSKLLQAFLSAKDMKEFMNGWMAKPFLNPEGRPVRQEHWDAARARGEEAELYWEGWGAGCYLGADFRHNQCHVVIGEPEEIEVDGIKYPGRLAHLEIIEGGDWEDRLSDLMRDYGVEVAIIDFLPDTNRTLKFAKKHAGRVYLAEYRGAEKLSLPENRKKGNRRVAPDGREEFKVHMNQVKSLQDSLGSFASGQWVVPQGPLRQRFTDPRNYVLEDFDVVEGQDGKGREGFKHHLQGLALRNTQGQTKTEHGEKVNVSGEVTQEFYDAGGFDPHFAHAYNYMHAASQVRSSGLNILRASESAQKAIETLKNTGQTRPGNFNLAALGPQGILGAQRVGRTCGTCRFGPEGEEAAACDWTGFTVKAYEPACNYAPGWRPRPK